MMTHAINNLMLLLGGLSLLYAALGFLALFIERYMNDDKEL
jgi:hypothetical protein